MLNMTKFALEVIPDLNMLIFFEKEMTGGDSYISNRYSKANNNYLKSYDPKQESKHINLEVNNLYVYGIHTILPTTGLKWIGSKEFDLSKYTSKS